MKKLFGVAIFLAVAVGAAAQNASLTVYFTYINVEEGYNHDCKTQVYIDGALAGESAVVKEDKGGVVKVNVARGKHSLRVVNLSLYEDNWEEHTVDNDYSIDAIHEEDHVFKKPEKLYLLFDIDSGTTHSWGKPAKKPKK
ncbi:MAG: hypothetical protein KIPDCIKN_01903 [Haliscomenobacter sp.]|jgi:hypothetical protein|nr:hypothetical protein [Haliscomenobacter sp.]